MAINREQKLAVDLTGLSPEKIKKIESLREAGTLSNGYANSELIEPVPDYHKAPCENVNFELTGTEAAKNNCWIILGRDRYDHTDTGYGGRGDTQAGAIYMCAGMNSAEPYECTTGNVELDPNGYPKDPTSDATLMSLEPQKTVRSVHKDASVIYLSQKTDIDTMFNLGGVTEEEHFEPSNYDSSGWGKEGEFVITQLMGISKFHVPRASPPHAAIGMKSDNIRIVGRESIRLQVSAQELASGATRNVTYGISLVGGGDPQLVQPAVKGYHMLASYRHLREALIVLSGALREFISKQTLMNLMIMMHEHVNGPCGKTEMISVYPAMIRQANMDMTKVLMEKMSTFTGRMGSFQDFVKPGDKFILSKNVFHD